MKNKKGFTVVELLVAFVIMSLIAGIGIIVYNSFLEKSESDYYHTIESNLLLSGNSYFQDNRSKLPVNNYTSVLVSDLIDQNYIEPIKDKDGNLCREGNVFIYHEDGKYNYEACIKCGDYESSGRYCSYGTGEKSIAYPTTALCKFKSNLTYTGSEITLTKVLETEAYTLTNNKGTTAGEYTVTASLKSSQGYYWNDSIHSTTDKTFKCSIYPAIPNITIPTKIEVVKGGTETFTEEAQVKGTFENISEDITIVTVSPKTNNDVDAEVKKTETVTGVEGGTTKIEVSFTPDDPNYKPVTKTIDVTVTKGIPIPTTSVYCKDLTYNGTEQVLTNAPDGEFVFSDNKGTDAKSYIVKANLTGSKTWEDGTTTEQTITCTIKKASITIPSSPEDKVYTGTSQTHGVTIPSKTSIVSGSDEQGTEVKDYKVTIKLDDTNNYEWSDKTISNKNITWKIVKADTTTVINTIENTYNGENQGASGASSKLNSNNQSITSATYSYKYYTDSSCTTGETSTSPKTAGQYYVIATLVGTNNYSGSSSGCTSYKMNKFVPTITISSTEGSVALDKNVSFNEKADVKGTFTNTIVSTTIGTVSPVNTSSINANTNTNVTVTGKAVGTTTVIITFTPDDTTNYASINSTSSEKKVYNLSVIEIQCNGVKEYWSGSECLNCGTNEVANSSHTGCVCASGYNEMINGNCGSCPSNSTYNSSTKTCVCNIGYYGSNCSTYCGGAYDHWTGSRCVSCSASQTWNGTSCVDPTPTCGGNKHWNGSACVCNTGYYGSNCNTYCGGTYDHWTGSTCVSCSSSQTWNGTSCVDPTPTCGGNKHWNGSACVCNTGYYGSNCSTYCGGTYDHWTGSACVSCSASQTWNGTRCVDPTPTCQWKTSGSYSHSCSSTSPPSNPSPNSTYTTCSDLSEWVCSDSVSSGGNSEVWTRSDGSSSSSMSSALASCNGQSNYTCTCVLNSYWWKVLHTYTCS